MLRKVLLVCYGAGHVNIMIPVYKRLCADGRVAAVPLALSIAKRQFATHGILCKTVVDYKAMIMDDEAQHYGEILADRWHVDSSGLSREDSLVYLGTSMRDLVRKMGEFEAFRQVETFGRQCFLPIWTMERIIDAEKPDLILTTNAPRMERAATLVGNRKGIPTINIHDDLGFMKRNYLLTGDRIAVMSEITQENLVAQGHDAQRIIVTGHPAFDAIPEELRNFKREEIIQKLQLPAERPYLLLATSQAGVRGQVMGICPLTCEVVEELKQFCLIIKPHPGEDSDAYRDFIRQRRDHSVVISGISIRELLAISKLLISFKSTTMLESVLMGKPIVSVNLTEGEDPYPYVRWGLGVEARDRKELRAGLETALADERFREGFQQRRQQLFGNTIDGQASKRVAGLVYDLLSQS